MGKALSKFAWSITKLGIKLPFILAGSLALGAMSKALGSFSDNLSKLKSIKLEDIAGLGPALAKLGTMLAKLGAVSPLILSGSIALATMSKALGSFGDNLSGLKNVK